MFPFFTFMVLGLLVVCSPSVSFFVDEVEIIVGELKGGLALAFGLAQKTL